MNEFKNKIIFGGAGPGAKDLVTIRLHNAIKQADIIIYAGSLVNPEILTEHKSNAQLYDSAGMDLHKIIDIMIAGIKESKNVLRVHTGDPAMYGAIAEQIKRLDAQGIDYEVIPGVSSVFAAAAAVKKELTLPGITQTMILTRRAGRTPVPPKERLELLASHNTSMGLFLSVGDIDGLVTDLLIAGYTKQTPIYVVYRASWPDQKIVEATLATVAQKVALANITRQAIVLVGNALSGNGQDSLLYDQKFTHGYRKGEGHITDIHSFKTQEFPFRFKGKLAIWSITKNGFKIANQIADIADAQIFSNLKNDLDKQWHCFDAHIFIMSTGIVVRKISNLIKSKLNDPAIICLDDKAMHAISLLSGHIGGANELTKSIANIVGAIPVITTASDVLGHRAFDCVATEFGWQILDKTKIKKLNMLLIEPIIDKTIAVIWPKQIFDKFYANNKCVSFINSVQDIDLQKHSAIVSLDLSNDDMHKIKSIFDLDVLNFIKPKLVIGIGAKAGGDYQELKQILNTALLEIGSNINMIDTIASVDIKQNEPAIVKLATELNVKTQFFTVENLNNVNVPTPSKQVKGKIGTASVAEASAMLASKNNRIITPKIKGKTVTLAIAI